jgi:hypothetical protein
MSWDREKALEHLRKHANEKSIGRCAAYTRDAIEAGGVVLIRHASARNYGISLLAIGFLPLNQDSGEYLAGDVVVIDGFDDQPHDTWRCLTVRAGFPTSCRAHYIQDLLTEKTAQNTLSIDIAYARTALGPHPLRISPNDVDFEEGLSEVEALLPRTMARPIQRNQAHRAVR